MAVKTKKTKKATPQEIINSFEPDELKVHEQLRSDPIYFAEKVVGFKPHKAQIKFLTADIESKRTLLPWARRFGKSWIVAVYLAWKLFSVKGYNAYIFAPSGEQSSVIFDYIVQIFETSAYLGRYTTFQKKGNRFSVGDKTWRSHVDLVKTGLTGDNARGHGVHGKKKGLIVFDEVNSFLYPEEVTAAIKPYVSISGGGIVYLGSPGEIGSWYHQTYEDWKQRQAEGSEKHLVIDCSWKDAPHIDPDFVAEERREAEVKGRLWQFEREYEGKFTQTEGAFFNPQDVRNCWVTGELQGTKGDTWIVGIDPGLDASPTVILWAKFNPLLDRLEICDCYSFIRDTNTKADRRNGHIVVKDYEAIIDFILDMRKSRPIHSLYLDTGIEKHFGERLANTFGINVIPDRIGGNKAKLATLRSLQRSLGDNRVVWRDHRITNQLLGFSPPINRQSGDYVFPDTDYDIISALCSLNRYFADREIKPFAFVNGGCCEW